MADDCRHEFVFLTSHRLCEGQAQICAQKCYRKGHIEEEHIFHKIENFANQIKIKRDKGQSLQFYQKKLKQSFEQKKKELEASFKYALSSLSNNAGSENARINDLINLFENKRYDRLTCSDVYELNNYENPSESEMKRIVKDFEESYSNAESGFGQTLKKIIGELEKQFEKRLTNSRKQSQRIIAQLQRKLQETSLSAHKKGQKAVRGRRRNRSKNPEDQSRVKKSQKNKEGKAVSDSAITNQGSASKIPLLNLNIYPQKVETINEEHLKQSQPKIEIEKSKLKEANQERQAEYVKITVEGLPIHTNSADRRQSFQNVGHFQIRKPKQTESNPRNQFSQHFANLEPFKSNCDVKWDDSYNSEQQQQMFIAMLEKEKEKKKKKEKLLQEGQVDEQMIDEKQEGKFFQKKFKKKNNSDSD